MFIAMMRIRSTVAVLAHTSSPTSHNTHTHECRWPCCRACEHKCAECAGTSQTHHWAVESDNKLRTSASTCDNSMSFRLQRRPSEQCMHHPQ